MRIHHLALRTTDVPRLLGFYAGVMGLRVTRDRGEEGGWLDAGGTIVMIERAGPDEPGVDARTMELVAFAIEPREARAFEARLASAGVRVEARTRFTVYVRDPDGRRVGLSHYPEDGPA